MKFTCEQISPEINTELQAVHQALIDVAEALYFPLNNLVHEEIRKAEPFTRAAVVLATACNDDSHAILRDQRINLAAALEMLYIALNIHKLLLSSTTPNHSVNGKAEHEQISHSIEESIIMEEPTVEQSDKVVMGSTILAGDYCFSRSAALATKTGNPEVVNIFSEALKNVSEEHLRSIFNESSLFKQEDETLVLAGVQAATTLIDAPSETTIFLKRISSRLIKHLSLTDTRPDLLLDELATHKQVLSDSQLIRWREIISWLAT